MTTAVIRTSNPEWAKSLALAYKEKRGVTVLDDARYGIDPREQSLFDMTRRAGLTAREIVGVVVACGMSVVGAGLLVAAFLDPEPLSKMGLAVGGGITMVLGGGTTAIAILTGRKPPSVAVLPNGGFGIRWD